MRNLLTTLFLLFCCQLLAQNNITIGLINDQPPDSNLENQFENSIKEEILQLLQYRYEVQFNTYYLSESNQDINNQINEAFAKCDILVGLGTISSNLLVSLEEYVKPTIASLILDTKLQGVKKTPLGTSGVNNFSYLESPFNLERDLKTLYEYHPFDHLLVASEAEAIGGDDFTMQLFSNYLEGKNITISLVHYGDDLEPVLDELKDKNMATYGLPYLGKDTTIVNQFFSTINNNKITSAALFGESYVQAGALLGYETNANLLKIPRRIALKVMKIAEGQNASTLSTEMQTFGESLVINMKTAREIGIYPDFDLMAKATVLNLATNTSDETISIYQAVGEALSRNLNLKIETADVAIQDLEIGIAKADMLPQVNINSTYLIQDELTTLTRQGAQGKSNWLVGGDLTQVLLSEPLLANIAIQKMLKESAQQELLQVQLDVILDVASAYINILFAKSNLNIQLQNVSRNKENYSISKAKEAIGYSGTSDINRWEAELANANIELNNAVAQVRQVKFQLNQLMNRPINAPLEIEDLSFETSLLRITGNRPEYIQNYGDLKKFSNFLVSYALKNLPALAQIDIATDVQERLQLSRERALFLPSLALSGSANRTLAKFNVPENFPDSDNVTTWNIGLGLSYPIFQGNKRKRLVEQSKINILQLQDTRRNAENQFELRVRAEMENVGASFSQVRLTKTAAEASNRNFQLIQDAYSTGQANVTTLIDAQNNALFSELSSTNAVYSFILDYLTLERAIGHYNFLDSEEGRTNFTKELTEYLDNY